MENRFIDEILQAREQRAERQCVWTEQTALPLVSFTMNIAGPDKGGPLVALAFREGCRMLTERLGHPIRQETHLTAAGYEALFAYDLPPQRLKETCVSLEETPLAGRLFDFDVILTDGTKLAREIPRTCIVCGGPVTVCSRNRAHGLDTILAETRTRLSRFACEALALSATDALIAEAALTPKPGLVDRANSGAHTDMDILTFRASANALMPYFRESFLLGFETMPPSALQQAGIAAERTMFDATNGVNTHLGAVYTFGLYLYGLGRHCATGTVPCLAASDAARALLPAELAPGDITGARLEAVNGFPHAKKARALLKEDGGPYVALLTLMSETEDRNLLRRGGCEGLAFAKRYAQSLMCSFDNCGHDIAWLKRELVAFDEEMIIRHLSPGGSADLLALALLMERAETLLTP